MRGSVPGRTRAADDLLAEALNLLGGVGLTELDADGRASQLSSHYSRTVRPDEKRPIRATVRMAMRVQFSRSPKACDTRSWQAT